MARILIVEDDEAIRANLTRVLRLEGHEPLAAASGEEGFALAKAHGPELLLCDIVMGELDGYGLLAALREDPATAAIPVVFVTASADAAERERVLVRGAQGYLAKPFNLKDVLAVIDSLLGTR